MQHTSKGIMRAIYIIEDYVVIVGFCLMVAVVCASVFFRYVLKNPLIGTDEIGPFLLVILTWIGAGIVTRRETHINLDLFSVYVHNEKILRLLHLFNSLLGVLAGGILIYLAYEFLLIGVSQAQTSSTLRIPMYWPYSSMLVGACLITLHYVILFVRDGTHIIRKKYNKGN